MKYLLLSFISFSLHAGHPDSDFVIDAIRQSFSEGSAPSIARTMPDGLWVCGKYSARGFGQSGKPGVTLGGAKYTMTSQGLMSKTSYYKTDVPYSNYGDSLMSFYIKNQDLKYYHFVRENHEGLIIERAQVSTTITLPSIIMPELQAIDYAYCLPYGRNYLRSRKKVFNFAWDAILDYQETAP